MPGAGRQEVLLTLDEPGAIRLTARSPSGTACEIIDRVRGPFASAGSVGGVNCDLDLLLDAGQYKVRLESPRRGKGNVTVSATPFVEVNPTSTRLVAGTGVTTTLKRGQQASWWLSLSTREVPWVRISGRHAGDVRLWRNGQWLEPQQPSRLTVSPRPGQPRHEWWLDSTLEAGEYRLVVYGRDATTVTGNTVDDSLVVEMGFRPGPPERSVDFTLPASGLFTVRVPSESLAGLLSLEGSPSSTVELQALRSSRAPTDACRIEKGALVPECSVVLDGGNHLAVLAVRGPPGQRGRLSWAEYRTAGMASRWGGYYGPSTGQLSFRARPGRAALAVVDLPDDTDGPPQGCQLELLRGDGEVAGVVARDVVRLGDGEKLERQFNYGEDGAIVWFEIAPGGNVLQRTGLTSRRYRITTAGGRKSSCEVYRLSDAGALTRLTQTNPDAKECNALLALEPGVYQLQLSGGLSGVESLRIEPDGVTGASPVKARGGCLLPDVTLQDAVYRLVLSRRGEVRVRGLELATLPLEGGAPFHLRLDARRSVSFPVQLNGAAALRSAGGAPYACSLARGATQVRGGECLLAAGTTDTLTLTNPGDEPVSLTLSAPASPPALEAPRDYKPTLTALPAISPDAPTFFNFERGQTHSVRFDVEQPGLYNVTTQGLLATSCRLRTPVIDEVAENTGGGRGRNCLIQTYLQKGSYLFSATTTGSSTGRAALSLSRRPARQFPGVTGEGEQFFRVDANELVQQRLTVKAAGEYELGTTDQGNASLACRLDDPSGWPIERVPSACSGRRALLPGTWLWTQLPLTVESMRRTKLVRTREAVTLKGNRPHRIEAFTWYTAELGGDGKDEFLFSLEGETQLDVVLTAGMQGRIFLLEADKPPKAVEVVPPMQPASSGDDAESYEPESAGGEGRESDGDGGEGEARAENDSPEGEYEAEDEPQAAAVELAQARAAPPPPSGVKLTLPAGNYKLVAEHSRGDVGVTYQLHFGSQTLLPGMARSLPVPATVPLFVPRDGTLRLRTEGEADVRCRVLDERGRVVLEGSENGADWNCALAEPIAKGRYTLLIESETQRPGETRVAVSLPPVEDKGAFADGLKLTLGGPVVSFAIPVAERDAVQEVVASATGKAPLSCALEAADGQVVYRRSRASTCAVMLRPKLERYRLRLWTTDGTANVLTAFRSRPIAPGGPGQLPAAGAISYVVPRAGRYRTAPQVYCLGGDEPGQLRLCGPEVSLEAGTAIFTTGGTRPLPFPLEEQVAAPGVEAQPVALSRRPFIQVVRAQGPSLFLLEARVQYGERVAPSCAFDGAGTVRERRDGACFAASRVGPEAVSRLWAPSESDVEATLLRRAVTLPAATEALAPGRRRLSFKEVGRFALPKAARARVELTLPKDAWAVLLDDGGAALDVCAPSDDLRRCLLTGQAGSVVLVSAEGRAEATTVMLEGAAPSVAFTGLYEDTPRVAGTVRLSAAAADGERLVMVEGALRCTVALADGTRVASCRAKVPARQAVELLVEHGTTPLRALVHAPGRERHARLSLELPALPGPALQADVAVPVAGGRIDRTLVIDREAVVRVSAEAGVCGLFRGNDLLAVDGLDAGCELVRVLSPGSYRVLVRPFAGRPLPGTLRWSADPVTQLAEGVGPEAWLAPGEVRLYRFDTANRGKVGLGLQARSELLDCAVYNDGYQLLGEGCHQYLTLEKGRFLLTVRNPPSPGAAPLAVRPVLLGLSGEKNDVPEEYLSDFFRRVGMSP